MRRRLIAISMVAKVAVPIALLLADAALGLWRVHEKYFVSVPIFQYLSLVWAGLAGLIAVATGLVPVYRVARSLINSQPLPHKAISVDRVLLTFVTGTGRLLRRWSFAIAATSVLLAGAAGLLFFMTKLKPADVSSGVLAATIQDGKNGFDKNIYVAEPSNGQVEMFVSSDLNRGRKSVAIGSQGNVGERGAPTSMIEVRRRNLDLIFVLDAEREAIQFIDINKNSFAKFETSLRVHPTPKAMAITPDGRKLFVSHEQAAPNGYISVFDISKDDPGEFREVSEIAGVNCPEGRAVSSKGDRLFVATQCGGDKDPVMVIDTAANTIVSSITGLAVGTSVAASRDGRRLYVGRGNFPCTTPLGSPGSPLSVVDLGSQKIINTVCLRTSVGAIAISRDDKELYLVVLNGDSMSVFDRLGLDKATNTLDGVRLNDIRPEAPIDSFGIADDNSLYAFISKTPRLFLYSRA
jgi:DNA-binding beta-propeller fold protein YncE